MLEAIKKLFTKTVQLTSEIFQKAEIIEEESEETKQHNSSEPKIKKIKRQVSYRTSSKYR
jgi:hypothetical protein